jgi:TRAP-type C4-dicarboxylate transport system permease small subunit
MREPIKTLTRALEWALMALLSLLVLMVSLDTLLWTTLAVSLPQLAEVQAILQIWFALLGAAYGVQRGFHLGLEMLVARLGDRWRAVAHRFGAALVAASGLLLLRYGWELFRVVDNTLPATRLPASSQYLPTWIAGGLIFIFAALQAVGGETGRDGGEEVTGDA